MSRLERVLTANNLRARLPMHILDWQVDAKWTVEPQPGDEVWFFDVGPDLASRQWYELHRDGKCISSFFVSGS